jgi:hypothetical protein
MGGYQHIFEPLFKKAASYQTDKLKIAINKKISMLHMLL